VQRCAQHAEVGVNLPWALYWKGGFELLLGHPYPALTDFARAVALSSAEFMLDAALTAVEGLAHLQQPPEGTDWVRRLLLLAKAARFPQTTLDKRLKKLASKPYEIREPVVIVAGGCDATVEERMRGYWELLEAAFCGYQGTVISGGTTSGISGLVGELSERYPGHVHSIGYVPEYLHAGETLDERYSEIRRTQGHGFSALEPLQNWIDVLASGIDPARVKVVGLNGGTIAAFEFRLALALGARVGIVRQSGREADRLVLEADLERPFGLAILPADPMTLWSFVRDKGATGLPAGQREQVARAIHEQYRQDKKAYALEQDPAMQDWDALSENLKDANRQQADDVAAKLAAIGKKAVPVSGRAVQRIELTDQEVDLLAEMEHARWVVERLLDGWTSGPRDHAKKQSPYLVAWEELDEGVKDWDRNPMRKIPEFLAGIGLEIQPA
jgi:hypothetical protein